MKPKFKIKQKIKNLNSISIFFMKKICVINEIKINIQAGCFINAINVCKTILEIFVSRTFMSNKLGKICNKLLCGNP
mgnify:CR=1 FL=1